MPRSQNKVASHRRRRKLLKLARGFWGTRKNVLTVAKHHIDKSFQHAYKHRRTKEREFRQLWITRINAAARLNGISYSRLIDLLNKKQVLINRKVLADLAVSSPDAFAQIVKFVSA